MSPDLFDSFEEQRFLPALRAALLMLSLPPQDQIRLNSPGCAACDLLDDFKIAAKDVLTQLEEREDKAKVLKAILTLIAEMDVRDYECFNANVLRRSSWQLLREKSHEALTLFAWHDASLEPFTEVEPGVWLRRRPSG